MSFIDTLPVQYVATIAGIPLYMFTQDLKDNSSLYTKMPVTKGDFVLGEGSGTIFNPPVFISKLDLQMDRLLYQLSDCVEQVHDEDNVSACHEVLDKIDALSKKFSVDEMAEYKMHWSGNTWYRIISNAVNEGYKIPEEEGNWLIEKWLKLRVLLVVMDKNLLASFSS